MKQLFRNRTRAAKVQSRRRSFLQGQASRRTLHCEKLEDRALMAGDVMASEYWNAVNPTDVNGDSIVSPLDALLIINQLNASGPRELVSANSLAAGGEGEQTQKAYLDVNNDGFLTPLDALGVINELNGEGEHDPQVEYTFRALQVGTNTEITRIDKGQDFDLQVRVRDLRLGGVGVFGGYVDLTYDDSKVSVYVNEIQHLIFSGNPQQATFTLRFNGSAPSAPVNINFFDDNSPTIAGKIKAALETIPGLAGNVEVVFDSKIPNPAGPGSDPPLVSGYQIRFINALGDTDVGQVTIGTSSFVGGTSPSIVTQETGKGVITNPYAFREAFRSRLLPPFVTQVFYTNGLNAENLPNEFNNAGALGEFAEPGSGRVELLRVRINANDGTETGAPLVFTPDVIGVPDTLLFRSNVPVPKEEIILVPFTPLVINERLSAKADSGTIAEDNTTGITIDVLANDLFDSNTADANPGVSVIGDPTVSVSGINTTNTQGTVTPVTVSGRTQLRFVPAPNFSGTTSFKYTLNKTGEISDTTTVTVTVTPDNDAPVNNVPLNPSTNEDIALTFSGANGNAISISDADAGSANVEVTLSAANGSLQLLGVTGLTVNGNGSSTMTVTGTLTNINAALQAGLRYTPTLNFNGPTTVTVSTNDLGNAPLPPKSTTTPINITVIAQNDAPQNTVPGLQTVTEGEALVFNNAGLNAISVADVEATNVQVTLSVGNGKLKLNPIGGTPSGLIFDAGADNSATMTFTGSIANVNAALQGMTYTSNMGFFNQNDTLTIVTSDLGVSGSGGTLTDSDTVSIRVNPGVLPRASRDTATFAEDSSGNVLNVLVGDVPHPGTQAILLGIETMPLHGTVSINQNGTPTDQRDDFIVYTPTGNYFGPDTFTYRMNDTNKLSDPGNVNGQTGADAIGVVDISVTNVADAPIVSSTTLALASSNEDVVRIITAAELLVNATDADGDVLSVEITDSTGINGTLVANGDGNFTYTPTQHYFGPASFKFRAKDPAGMMSAEVTASFTVNSVNDAPVAANDPNYTTLEDTDLVVNAAAGVLANDTDADVGSTRTAVLVAGPNTTTQGTLNLAADGSFVFDPVLNFTGNVTFTYQARDDFDGTLSNVATATINVSPVNDAPVAVADGEPTGVGPRLITVGEGGSITINPLVNDTDVENSTLSVSSFTQAVDVVDGTVKGTVARAAGGTSLTSLTYTPPPFYNGRVRFTYQATDGQLVSNTVNVDITVTPFNDPPIANPDSVIVVEDVATSFDVRGNDSDQETASTSLAIASFTQPTRGSLSLSGTTFTYTSALNDNSAVNGDVTFTYFVSDGEKQSATPATVTITISAVNDAPVAANDGAGNPFIIIKNGGAQSITGLISNDTDVDAGTVLNISRLQETSATAGSPTTFATARGTVRLGTGNTVIYTPNPGEQGTDSFTYRVTDGGLESNPATVFIDVVDFIPTDVTGVVFVDGSMTSNVGVLDGGDRRLANVTLKLTGTDLLGNAVNKTVRTDINGFYSFVGVFPNMTGTRYVLEEIQPAGVRDGSETGGGSFASSAGNDKFFIDLPRLGIPGGAHNTNFSEIGIDPTQLRTPSGLAMEMLGSSTSNNGAMVGTDVNGNATWFFSLNGWANLPNLRIVLDSIPSAATLHYTTASGPKTHRIFQDPGDSRNLGRVNGTSMARFRIISEMSTGGGYLIRLDGTIAEFGISLAAAQAVQGEGEAAMSNPDFSRNADAVFAEQSWA